MKNPRTFGALASDAIAQDGTSWVEVMPTADKARNGPYFFTVTTDDLKSLVAAIEDHGERIMVDYDHPEAGDSTRAAGWFTGQAKHVAVAEENPRGETQDHESVWAQVKWTPDGKTEVEGQVYKFVSPEWQFEQRDKKTGLMTRLKDLVALTLTNRPFFSDLAPVVASDLDSDDAISAYAHANSVTREHLQTVLTAVAKDTPLDQVLAKARELKDKTDPSAKEDEVNPEVLKALGLKEDATAEEIVAAVTDLKEKVAITEGFDASVLKALANTSAREIEKDRELAKLQRETAKATHERNRDDMLAKACEEGRILPVHKDSLKAVYDSTSDGPEKVKAIIDASPARTWDEHGAGGEGADETPDVREIRDNRGNLVASVVDDAWLDRKAKAILAEKGKTLKNATADEYAAALEQARAIAATR